MSHEIVFLDRATIPSHVAFSSPSFVHTWIDHDLTEQDQVIERCINAHTVITNKVSFDADLLAKLPALKHIAVIATGYNVIDIEACKAKGVTVSNTPGYSSVAVPEYTIGMMFALRRHLFAYRDSVMNGDWQRADNFHGFLAPALDLANSQLGIIGGGDLGASTAKLAIALGMNVVFADRKGQPSSGREGYASFESVLRESDIISIHCPLNEHTHNLIAAKELALMKSTGLLINTARGGIVNESDLVEALNNEAIAGAGFDVATTEPIASDNPLLSIIDKPNFILTPHIAWTSNNALQTQADMVIKNIENFLEGKSFHRVV